VADSARVGTSLDRGDLYDLVFVCDIVCLRFSVATRFHGFGDQVIFEASVETGPRVVISS